MMITAKKRKAGQLQGKTPFPISIGVGGGDGEIVDITDPDQRKKMNGEQKQAAIQQVSATESRSGDCMPLSLKYRFVVLKPPVDGNAAADGEPNGRMVNVIGKL